jgi:hypothetical protein
MVAACVTSLPPLLPLPASCPAAADVCQCQTPPGITNTQGAWVTPAFQLHHSKVDAMEPRPAAQMRTPLGRPAAQRPAAAALAAAPTVTAAPAAAALAAAGPAAAAAPAAAAVAAPAEAAAAAAEVAAPAAAAAAAPGGVAEQQQGDQAAGCSTAWFTHLVFDCDGVLVDTERASCEALRRALLEVRQRGQQPPAAAAWRRSPLPLPGAGRGACRPRWHGMARHGTAGMPPLGGAQHLCCRKRRVHGLLRRWWCPYGRCNPYAHSTYGIGWSQVHAPGCCCASEPTTRPAPHPHA